MSKVIESWILMWGLTYLICAVVKPDIFGFLPPIYGFIALLVIGSLMLTGLLFSSNIKGRTVLFVMGIIETIGGIASWSGAVSWNVPFHDKAVFNVSMAFLDFFGAVALFTKSMEKELKIRKIKSIVNKIRK